VPYLISLPFNLMLTTSPSVNLKKLNTDCMHVCICAIIIIHVIIRIGKHLNIVLTVGQQKIPLLLK